MIILEYVCHGHWTDNTTTYIVAKHSGSSHGVCITFKQNVDGTNGQLIVGDSCQRGALYMQPIPDKHLVSNLTQFGKFKIIIIVIILNFVYIFVMNS